MSSSPEKKGSLSFEYFGTALDSRSKGEDDPTLADSSVDFNNTIKGLLKLNNTNNVPVTDSGSEAKVVYKDKLQPVTMEKRATDYHQQYKLNPLEAQQFKGGRAAFREEFHSPWIEAINKTPANAGRGFTEESGPHAVHKTWLDKYNAEMHGGEDSTPVTQENLNHDPHLARILAGFAIQDRVNEEVNKHGSEKVPYSSSYTSPWAQKPASASASASVSVPTPVPTPAPVKPKRGLFGRAADKVKSWFGFGKKK